MAIPFTQYLMPDGQQRPTKITRPRDVEAKAVAVIEAGGRFECEMLSDYRTVSLTVAYEDEDIAIEVVPNGPDVLLAVDRLVRDGYERLATGKER